MFGIQDSRSRSLRAARDRRSGVVVSKPYDGSREIQFDTWQCVHCSLTQRHEPGSGRLRGYCLRCPGFVCGRPACVRRGCVSKEQELDLMSRGVPWDQVSSDLVPVVVAVPAGVPGGIILGKS
jgi:hypothetical protein